MASNPRFNPNDFIAGNARPVLPGPGEQLAADQPRAHAVRAGSTFKLVHVDRHAAEPSCSPTGADDTVVRDTRRLLHASATTEQRATRARRCYGHVDLPGALDGVERRVLLHGRATSSGTLPRRGQAAGTATSPATDPRRPAPGGNAIQHTARTYGFGEPTGLGLGDQAGRDPRPRVPGDAQHEQHRHTRSGAAATAPASRSARATCSSRRCSSPTRYAAFANGGTLYEPRLADEVTQSSAGPAGSGRRPSRALQPTVRRTTGSRPTSAARSRPVSPGSSTATGTAPRQARSTDYQGMPVDRQDRHRAGATTSRTRRGSPAITNPDNPTPRCRSTSSWSMVERGRVRCQHRRADRPPGHRLPQQPERAAGAGRRRPAAGNERATDVDDQREPHRATRTRRGSASRRDSRRRRCGTSTGCSSARRSRITGIGLLMIYSTTHQRIPRRPATTS